MYRVFHQSHRLFSVPCEINLASLLERELKQAPQPIYNILRWKQTKIGQGLTLDICIQNMFTSLMDFTTLIWM